MKDNSDSGKHVGIVVLNYNNSSDTVECIDSILRNNYSNYDLIIVDNNSTDKSVSRITEWIKLNSYDFNLVHDGDSDGLNSESKKITVIKSGRNGGYGYGNNIGIKYALKNGADYVLVLNNDTVVDRNFLQPLVNKCNGDNSVGIVSGKINYYNNPEIIWSNGGTFDPDSGKIVHLNIGERDKGQKPTKEITFLSGCMWFIPKEVFEKVGFIDERFFMYMEDVDFCIRVTNANFKLFVVDESKILHKAGSTSGEFSKFSVYWRSKNYVLLLRKHYPDFLKRVLSIAGFSLRYNLRLLRNLKVSKVYIHFKGMFDGLKRDEIEKNKSIDY